MCTQLSFGLVDWWVVELGNWETGGVVDCGISGLGDLGTGGWRPETGGLGNWRIRGSGDWGLATR